MAVVDGAGPTGFEDWLGRVGVPGRWADAAGRCADLAVAAPPRVRGACRLPAVRAGALATGSISGYRPIAAELVIDVALERPGWEAGLMARHSFAPASLAAQLRVADLTWDAAQARTPLSRAWIDTVAEQLHAVRGRRVPTRTEESQVRASDGSAHVHPDPESIEPAMTRLFCDLNSTLFEMANPIVGAAYAYFSLVDIHPWRDGNGRAARALASTILERTLGVPFVLFPQHRWTYQLCVDETRRGEPMALVDFITASVVATARLTATVTAGHGLCGNQVAETLRSTLASPPPPPPAGAPGEARR